MSTIAATIETLRTQADTDLATAFPANTETNWNDEYSEPDQLPHVYAALDSVDYDSDEAPLTGVHQTHSFGFLYRYKRPENTDILADQAEKADALINQLMQSANYAGIAFHPKIEGVTFNVAMDDTHGEVVEVLVNFSCVTETAALTTP